MTEHIIPANAEGLSIRTVIAPKLLAEAEAANKSATVAYAMIEVCKAASEFLDDQHGYDAAKNVPGQIAICLGHANKLIVDMIYVIEGVVASGRKS